MTKMFRNDDLGKLILRLALGALVLLHGIAKLLNPAALESIGGRLAPLGLPAEFAYGVYLGEVVGPLLVMLGLLTRFGGLLILINMLFAIGLVHAHQLLLLTDNGGWQLELQGMYLFGSLAVIFLGSGRMAIRPD